LSRPDRDELDSDQELAELLSQARSFSANEWAQDVQDRSPQVDTTARVHVASAYQKAVCLYLLRVMDTVSEVSPLQDESGQLLYALFHHLEAVNPNNALFTATTWSAFVAGAETTDRDSQAWVKQRFQRLWQQQPWGVVLSALQILSRIWHNQLDNAGQVCGTKNWIEVVKSSHADVLIL
jgi:hypothetical protein